MRSKRSPHESFFPKEHCATEVKQLLHCPNRDTGLMLLVGSNCLAHGALSTALVSLIMTSLVKKI